MHWHVKYENSQKLLVVLKINKKVLETEKFAIFEKKDITKFTS